tara:strand:+ start:16870 stop:17151 length:282 start_codon:yes stop_codon:yes gene_type:complete
MNYWDRIYAEYNMNELVQGMNDDSLLDAQRKRYKEEFDKRLSKKLADVEEFEKLWGECTSSRAMRKYCTSETYRQRVRQFNNATAQTIKYYKG